MLEANLPGGLLNMFPPSGTSNYIIIASTEIRTEFFQSRLIWLFLWGLRLSPRVRWRLASSGMWHRSLEDIYEGFGGKSCPHFHGLLRRRREQIPLNVSSDHTALHHSREEFSYPGTYFINLWPLSEFLIIYDFTSPWHISSLRLTTKRKQTDHSRSNPAGDLKQLCLLNRKCVQYSEFSGVCCRRIQTHYDVSRPRVATLGLVSCYSLSQSMLSFGALVTKQ
jgi:hypothetical protein